MSTSFLSQNKALLARLRPCDSGNDGYRLLESESGDVRYAMTL